jgi:PleD family two-component response regulator
MGAELLAVTGLIRAADQALYAAKAAGRDTVIAASASVFSHAV